ncbi:zincin-like metallopeptidase domain-containing protein [Mesorhizobium sp. M1348]|uniref:ArdC family protein n=1 Tax=Mesorhizobium sp. M1348 TaxID=2957089 RepID=UPI00333D8263
MASLDRADVYARITAEIVAAIEAGAGEYVMPWHHNGSATARPVNVASGKAYRGVNTLALWVAAQSAAYPTGLWGTYRQWQALGAQVRKGERSTTVVFWKQIGGDGDEDDSGSDDGAERRRFFARGYSVFNCAQVDGYEPEPIAAHSEEERVARYRHQADRQCVRPHADAFYANLGINTVYGGNEAYYLPSADRVHLPSFSSFRDAASHYSVLFHEGLHATAAKHRLDRDLSGRFGSEAYAMEEIIAQVGSSMILADLGIVAGPRPDDASYISSWLKVLRNDSSAIFTAASKAQQAADWMHARQPSSQVSAAA